VFPVPTQHEVIGLPSASGKKLKAVASSLTPQSDARLVCYIRTPRVNILPIVVNLTRSPLTRGPMTSSRPSQSKQARTVLCLCLLQNSTRLLAFYKQNAQLQEGATVPIAEKAIIAETPLEEQPEGSDTVWDEMDDRREVVLF
jgi:hypothetical protein